MSVAAGFYGSQSKDLYKKLTDATAVVEKGKKEDDAAEQLAKKLLKGHYSDVEPGLYSDFKVKCFEKIFNLHRIIVCPQSKFFAAALRPGGFQESTTGLINLPEDDPRIFEMFTQLMYLGRLDAGDKPATPKEEKTAEETLMDMVKLYVMADKYGGAETVKVAYKLAVPLIYEALNKATRATTPFDQINLDVAVPGWYLFTGVIAYIFSNLASSKDPLKKACVRIAGLLWRFLLTPIEQIMDFLKRVPDFAFELLASRNDGVLFSSAERSSSQQLALSKEMVEKAQRFDLD